MSHLSISLPHASSISGVQLPAGYRPWDYWSADKRMAIGGRVAGEVQ